MLRPASSSTETVALQGGRLATLQAGGEGIPIVFLHGSGSAKEVFARQFADPLLAARRLIAIDLPGHGMSADALDPRDYTLRGFTKTVAAALAEMNIPEAALVGWSLGGHVALELMATTALVAGAMIVGAPPIPLGPIGTLRGFHMSRDVLLTSKEIFTERDRQRFLAACFGEDAGEPGFVEALERADSRVRSHFPRSMMLGEGADERRAVSAFAGPVAIVNGAAEPFARLSYMDGLAYGNLWQGECRRIEGAGHAPFWQRPQVFNRLLASFVGDVDAFVATRPRLHPARVA